MRSRRVYRRYDAACATGKGAVSQSDTFEFVSSGRRTTVQYPVPQRKKVAKLEDHRLREPGKDISLADHSGKVVLLNLWASSAGRTLPNRTR
ncbi:MULTISPECIES: hypothetical protein [Amycolatopsis]|uniref:Integrase n=1 Tax=Amycolatopsis albidoflavus TaxID=102226 RepID=A0ABW5IDX7_9PSEU